MPGNLNISHDDACLALRIGLRGHMLCIYVFLVHITIWQWRTFLCLHGDDIEMLSIKLMDLLFVARNWQMINELFVLLLVFFTLCASPRNQWWLQFQCAPTDEEISSMIASNFFRICFSILIGNEAVQVNMCAHKKNYWLRCRRRREERKKKCGMYNTNIERCKARSESKIEVINSQYLQNFFLLQISDEKLPQFSLFL